jgi:hypothetical protein
MLTCARMRVRVVAGGKGAGGGGCVGAWRCERIRFRHGLAAKQPCHRRAARRAHLRHDQLLLLLLHLAVVHLLPHQDLQERQRERGAACTRLRPRGVVAPTRVSKTTVTSGVQPNTTKSACLSRACSAKSHSHRAVDVAPTPRSSWSRPENPWSVLTRPSALRRTLETTPKEPLPSTPTTSYASRAPPRAGVAPPADGGGAVAAGPDGTTSVGGCVVAAAMGSEIVAATRCALVQARGGPMPFEEGPCKRLCGACKRSSTCGPAMK